MKLEKLLTSFLLLFLMTGFTTAFEGGDGSSGDPYQIKTCQQLEDIQNSLSAHYELVQNVDCSETRENVFVPIATRSEFSGSLDGNGYVIKDLYIESNEQDVGLIGRVEGRDAVIRDIGVVNADIEGDKSVGAIVGSLIEGKVINVFSTGKVQGYGGIGGVVGDYGYSGADLTNAYSLADVSNNNYAVGGLVGGVGYSTITDSYSAGRVSGDTPGGFVGEMGSSDEFANDYFDIESSGQTSGVGGEESSENIVGLTTQEMQGSSAESNMQGLDFTNTWDTVEESDPDSQCDNYPVLQSLNRSVQIEAQNCAPEPDFSFSPSNPIVGDSISFDASNSTDDGGITSFNWNWSDGSLDTGETASHTFDNSGDYEVELEVEDDKGATSTTVKTVSVNNEATLQVDWSDYNSRVEVDGFNIYHGIGEVNESNKKEVGSSETSTEISSQYWSSGDNVCVEIRPFNDAGEAESDEQCVQIEN